MTDLLCGDIEYSLEDVTFKTFVPSVNLMSDDELRQVPRPSDNQSLIFKIDESDHDFYLEVTSVNQKILLSKLIFSLISDLQDENETQIEHLMKIGKTYERERDIEDAIRYAEIQVRKLRQKMGQNSREDCLGFVKKTQILKNKPPTLNCKYSDKLKNKIRQYLYRNYKPREIVKILKCAPQLVQTLKQDLGIENFSQNKHWGIEWTSKILQPHHEEYLMQMDQFDDERYFDFKDLLAQLKDVFEELGDQSYPTFTRDCKRLGLKRVRDTELFSEKQRFENKFKTAVSLIPIMGKFWEFPQQCFVDEKTYDSLRNSPFVIVNLDDKKQAQRSKSKYKLKCIAALVSTGQFVYRLYRGKSTDYIMFCQFLFDLVEWINVNCHHKARETCFQMDSASIHCVNYTVDFARKVLNIAIVRAIPYTPQCNPIEIAFGYSAVKLQKQRFTTEDQFLMNVVRSMPCFGKIEMNNLMIHTQLNFLLEYMDVENVGQTDKGFGILHKWVQNYNLNKDSLVERIKTRRLVLTKK